MGVIARLGEALAWLGRQGTRAVAATIFLGLAIPQLSDLLRPAVGPAIFLLLILAFLRVEPSAFRGQFKGTRLRLLLVAMAAMMIVTPLALGALYLSVGSGKLWQDLSFALVLQVAAPPIMSAPAFVALLGLDIALALAALVTSIAMTPISAPFFAALFGGDALPLDATALALRLAFLLGGSFVIARLIRRLTGDKRIRAWREHIDGLNVIALFVFAAAIMGIVTYSLFSDPLFVLALIGLSFFIAFALMTVTSALFWASGRERALTLGISAGMRNMGLMLAAASGVSDTVWLYFAVAQFPIYLAPWLLYPIVQRILRSQLPRGQ
jgi:BASS family bile acid:Na+ symporter